MITLIVRQSSDSLVVLLVDDMLVSTWSISVTTVELGRDRDNAVRFGVC